MLFFIHLFLKVENWQFPNTWAVLDSDVCGTVAPAAPVVLLVVELSEHPLVLAALFMPFLIGIVLREQKDIWSILTGRIDGEECPERESNPQGVATRGV